MPNQVSFRYFKTSAEIIQLAVMLILNADPIERQITCPYCISVLALSDITMGVATLIAT